jgi:hypothetical protein
MMSSRPQGTTRPRKRVALHVVGLATQNRPASVGIVERVIEAAKYYVEDAEILGEFADASS